MTVGGEKQVVVAAQAPAAFRLVERVLAALNYDVAWVDRAPKLQAAVRSGRIDLIVLDGTGELAAYRGFGDVLLEAGSRVPVLSLLRAASPPELAELMRTYRLTSFLGCTGLDTLDEVELMSTASKILEGNFFGVARYLGPTLQRHTFSVRHSSERHAVIAKAEEFAMSVGCSAHIASNFATVADELLTNALYNAPVAADGTPRFANLERATPIELAADEAVTAELAYDGRRLAVAVTDAFGSLSSDTALGYLQRCLARPEMHDAATSGGAGLGLYQVFRSVHHLVISIRPGKATETIGLIEPSTSYRKYAHREKSFNLFVAGEGK